MLDSTFVEGGREFGVLRVSIQLGWISAYGYIIASAKIFLVSP